jgi:hypothetical protein
MFKHNLIFEGSTSDLTLESMLEAESCTRNIADNILTRIHRTMGVTYATLATATPQRKPSLSTNYWRMNRIINSKTLTDLSPELLIGCVFVWTSENQ